MQKGTTFINHQTSIKMDEQKQQNRTISSDTNSDQQMVVEFQHKKNCFKRHPLRDLMNEKSWKLCSCHYKKQLVLSIFGICQQINAIHMWLHWNKIPQIIKEIKQTSFPNLQIINLGGNQITNIQGLSQMNMPHLKQLFLWHNFIIDITALRKAGFKQLKILDIGGNFIKQANFLSETTFHVNLTRLVIDDNRFFQINDFVPVIAVKHIKIELLNNKFVHIREFPSRKGKKDISEFQYFKNKAKYF